MDEEAIRNVFADEMACGFLVELLLTDYLKRMPEPIRPGLVAAMRQTGRRIDHYAGLAKDERTAELLADVTVRMHDALDGYLDRALARLAAGQATSL
jgi:hypothetical protein